MGLRVWCERKYVAGVLKALGSARMARGFGRRWALQYEQRHGSEWAFVGAIVGVSALEQLMMSACGHDMVCDVGVQTEPLPVDRCQCREWSRMMSSSTSQLP